MEEGLIVHSDGGARGNPGPGACAFIVEQGGRVIGKGAKYLGVVTNNIAEYQGVLLAVSWIVKNNFLFPITFYLDSELVAKQLSGLYKVKNKDLLKLTTAIKNFVATNNLTVVFKNIPRTKNKLADFLVNEELDKNISGKLM